MQVAAKGGQPVALRRVGPLQVKTEVQLAWAGVEHRLAKRQLQLDQLETSRLELGDQRPPIDRLVLIEAAQLADRGELPIDLHHPSADCRSGTVADHTIEAVISDVASMGWRKAEKAVDRVPLACRPISHGVRG